ncbi:uncharacterized protein CMU_024330 [Cryptosporidium muris RN66]|uniref:Uncharacterized protein n=1 Tax=Cryptosporidium muris (strain RN66) TaxID=441375 RepID=B6AAM6_CRYMR|nr:uncharacterized protein CMU_024330 [Cryptosporidium muris RN66]EEA05428.1 hypothetical protein, conserved [Cryptosporidium muris RN66]|eukprot:XP_002139777.1 hypothetical protein [Cryptosporidium muris RN66]
MTVLADNDVIRRLVSLLESKDVVNLESNVLVLTQLLDNRLSVNQNSRIVDCDCNKASIVKCELNIIIARTSLIYCLRISREANHLITNKVPKLLKKILAILNMHPIYCEIHNDTVEGLCLLLSKMSTLNVLKSIQNSLQGYAFWIYMQSESADLINKAKGLVSLATWIPSISNNISDCTSLVKFGYTPYSSELINRLIKDIEMTTDRSFDEVKLLISNISGDIMEIVDKSIPRIVKSLDLLSYLIMYSGVIEPPTTSREQKYSNSSYSIVTVLIPQIIPLLIKVRLILWDIIYYLVAERITMLNSKESDSEDMSIQVIEFINLMVLLRLNQKIPLESYFEVNLINKNNIKLYGHLFELNRCIKQSFNTLVISSGKTGVVLFSSMLSKFMKQIFQTNFTPCWYENLFNTQNNNKCNQLVGIIGNISKNHHCKLAFGLDTIINTEEQPNPECLYNNELIIQALGFFDKLFKEIHKVQELEKPLYRQKSEFLEQISLAEDQVYQILTSISNVYRIIRQLHAELRLIESSPTTVQDSLPFIDKTIINISMNIVIKNKGFMSIYSEVPTTYKAIDSLHISILHLLFAIIDIETGTFLVSLEVGYQIFNILKYIESFGHSSRFLEEPPFISVYKAMQRTLATFMPRKNISKKIKDVNMNKESEKVVSMKPEYSQYFNNVSNYFINPNVSVTKPTTSTPPINPTADSNDSLQNLSMVNNCPTISEPPVDPPISPILEVKSPEITTSPLSIIDINTVQESDLDIVWQMESSSEEEEEDSQKI